MTAHAGNARAGSFDDTAAAPRNNGRLICFWHAASVATHVPMAIGYLNQMDRVFNKRKP